MDAWMVGWMGEWMGGFMGKFGWMDETMDEWISRHFHYQKASLKLLMIHKTKY